MALISNITIFGDVVVPNCYVRINEVRWFRGGSANVEVIAYRSETKTTQTDVVNTYRFHLDLPDGSDAAGIYAYLKTMDEFTGAVDA